MLSLLFLYTNVTCMHCSAQLLHVASPPEAMCILCDDAYFTALKKLLRNLDSHDDDDDCIVSITTFPRMRRTYHKFRNIVKFRIPVRARTLKVAATIFRVPYTFCAYNWVRYWNPETVPPLVFVVFFFF